MRRIQFRLIYILAMLCVTGYGQKIIFAQNSGFVKTYVFEERKTLFYAVREFDNELLMTGQLKGNTDGEWGVFLARLDTMGNIIKLLIFQDPTDGESLIYPPVLSEPFYISGNGSAVLVGALDDLGDSFVMFIDPEMNDVQFYRYVHENLFDRYAFNCIVQDSAIYIVGNQREPMAGFEAYIQKIDLKGNIIWERSYGLSTGYDLFTTITSHENELFVIGTSRESNTMEVSEYERRTKILKIDTSGNIISLFISDINEEGGSAEELIIKDDKYYYTTHPVVVDDVGNVHASPQIVCRDADFNLVWRKDYGEPYFLNAINDIVFGPDGFLYAAGYIPEEYTWGRVLKIDPEDGEVIWEARDTAFVIPGWGSRNRMEGLTALPSGSLIAVGYTMDPTFRENGLLYKVTADGCIDTLCTTVSIEDLIQNPDERVVVYPNPASEMITFKLPESETTCIVHLYTIDGVQVQRQEVTQGDDTLYLNRSEYTQGFYFWKVTTTSGQIIDSGKVFIVK